MSRKFQHAAALAVAMMVLPVAGAATSGAFAQDQAPGVDTSETAQQPLEGTAADSPVRFVSQEVVQPLPGAAKPAADTDYSSLSDLVASIETDGEMSKDMRCLASAIYFEARGEPLAGQLAVAEVILNRAEAGRFGDSVCEVVKQPGQFSFVRRGRIPAIDAGRAAYRTGHVDRELLHTDELERALESPGDG